MNERPIKEAALSQVVATITARRVGDDVPPDAIDATLTTQDLLDAALAVATVLDRFGRQDLPLLQLIGEVVACRAAGVDPRPGPE